jgi:hypothetical protein
MKVYEVEGRQRMKNWQTRVLQFNTWCCACNENSMGLSKPLLKDTISVYTPAVTILDLFLGLLSVLRPLLGGNNMI